MIEIIQLNYLRLHSRLHLELLHLEGSTIAIRDILSYFLTLISFFENSVKKFDVKTMTNNNRLITTAISYPNAGPHIGHMYEAILGDILNRLSKVSKINSKLLTGTDEHGSKIQTTARAQGLTPKELCDINSQLFKDMLSKINVNYDRFIRTTDPDHIELVKRIILKSQDFIEKTIYSGYYNMREEIFITETDALKTDLKDPVTGIYYERREEETYNFKLSLFKDYIKQNFYKVTGFHTESFHDFMEDLRDLSITRIKSKDFDWGIDFPINPDHIVYVWLDASINYLTGAISLFEIKDNSQKPETIHVIGKDIVRFHSIMYPAILKSGDPLFENSTLDESKIRSRSEDSTTSRNSATSRNSVNSKAEDELYPIYDKIFVHGFIVDAENNKMSKSVGNVIEPNELLNEFSSDFIRFYMFMETHSGNDLKFSKERLMVTCESILVDNFYNLFNRFYKLVSDIEDYPFKEFSKFPQMRIERLCDFQYIKDLFMLNLSDCNSQITEGKPWKMSSEDKKLFMIDIGRKFYIILCVLSAIIPDKIKELNSYLGFSIPGIEYEVEPVYHYIPGLKTFVKGAKK